MLVFLNCLNDILKQFTIVESLKEQQAQHQKEHIDFPWGNHKGENPAKLPQYRIQPRLFKTPRKLLLSLHRFSSSLSQYSPNFYTQILGHCVMYTTLPTNTFE